MKKLLFVLLLLPGFVFSQATGKSISNKPSGGSIGTAATTVDILTSFNVNQTTAGQTLTVPNLTNVSASKVIYVNNRGTVSFILSPGGFLSPGKGVVMRWDSTQWNDCSNSLLKATGSISGILDSTDWQTFNDKVSFADTVDVFATKSDINSTATSIPLNFVNAATTSSLSVTYSSNTVTATGNGRLGAIDGVVLGLTDKGLLKNQSAQLQNGIYYVFDTGTVSTPYILVRDSLYDEESEIVPSQVNIIGGSTLAGQYVIQTALTVTVGATPITYTTTTAPVSVTNLATANLSQTSAVRQYQLQNKTLGFYSNGNNNGTFQVRAGNISFMNTLQNTGINVVANPGYISMQALDQIFISANKISLNGTSGVKVGSSGSADASSVMDVTSTTKGLLIPRMTTTNRDAIVSPGNSLLIFNTTTSAYNYYNGATWSVIGNVASITAGIGISVSGTTTPTVTNTGVLSVTAGTNVSVSGTATPTISVTGVVNSIVAGTGITVTGTATPTITISNGAGGIYAGSGTVPSSVIATITNTLTFSGGEVDIKGAAPTSGYALRVKNSADVPVFQVLNSGVFYLQQNAGAKASINLRTDGLDGVYYGTGHGIGGTGTGVEAYNGFTGNIWLYGKDTRFFQFQATGLPDNPWMFSTSNSGSGNSMYIGYNGATDWTFRGTNLGFGMSSFGTSATKTLGVADGTAPSTAGGTSGFQMYSTSGKPTFMSYGGGVMQLDGTQTSVNNSTSGTTKFSMPFSGATYKKVIVYLSAALGTAAYTFPVAFTNTPMIITSDQVAAAVVTALSTTAMTVTGATTSGFITLEGY